MSDTETSRFMSLILRHRPEEIGITLDAHGWAKVDELIAGIGRSRPFTMADLERIVAEDAKQRYSFNGDRTLIRANQGHSVPVDAEPDEKAPPEILYHGTGEKSAESILRKGILRMSRLYVHLSADPETALKVGSRHGRPVIFLVSSGRMHRDGYRFFISANGVWLTEEVPPEYTELMKSQQVLRHL